MSRGFASSSPRGARGYVRKPFRPEQLRDIRLPIIGSDRPAAQSITGDPDLSF